MCSTLERIETLWRSRPQESSETDTGVGTYLDLVAPGPAPKVFPVTPVAGRHVLDVGTGALSRSFVVLSIPAELHLQSGSSSLHASNLCCWN